jgi:hypothetical protein
MVQIISMSQIILVEVHCMTISMRFATPLSLLFATRNARIEATTITADEESSQPTGTTGDRQIHWYRVTERITGRKLY